VTQPLNSVTDVMRYDWKFDKFAMKGLCYYLGMDWVVPTLCIGRVSMEGSAFCGPRKDILEIWKTRLRKEICPYLNSTNLILDLEYHIQA
jgi:hypothetical protein